VQLHSVYLGRLHMREITIQIVEEENGRIAVNLGWGEWNSGTYRERIMAASMNAPLIELLKNLPVGTLVGHAQADTPEEARRICGLIADVNEANMKEENNED